MKFLVIDDNRLLCRFLTYYFKGKGHEATCLTDGTQAKDWLDQNKQCDGVILDIGMPRIDGITLLKRLRPEFPDLPIVMFTGLGYDEDLMAESRAAGCDGYVSKGLGPNELYNSIIKAIGSKQVAKA